eukprot:s109_g31.t1
MIPSQLLSLQQKSLSGGSAQDLVAMRGKLSWLPEDRIPGCHGRGNDLAKGSLRDRHSPSPYVEFASEGTW